MKHLNLSKWKNVRTAACFLLLFNTGCRHFEERASPGTPLSANAAENSYLKRILYSRNSDSVAACAGADFKANKYYLFTTTLPGDEKFTQYLVVYARQQYQVILVNCGCQSHPGACYYNNAMAVLLLKTKQKPFGTVYLEAKGRFNKLLRSRLSVSAKSKKPAAFRCGLFALKGNSTELLLPHLSTDQHFSYPHTYCNKNERISSLILFLNF
jgi:hypothetical protein